MKRNNHHRGFTLIELLVVVAIIAILASLLIPGINLVRNKVKQTQCVNHQRQLVLAATAYTNDWEGFLPYSQLTYAANTPWNITFQDYFDATGAPVTKATALPSKVFMCPMDPRPWSTTLANAPRSYFVVEVNGSDGWARMDDVAGKSSLNQADFIHPSSTILVGEYASSASAALLGNYQGSTNWCWGYASYSTYAGQANLLHGTRLNYAMADGHVEALEPQIVANASAAYWRPAVKP